MPIKAYILKEKLNYIKAKSNKTIAQILKYYIREYKSITRIVHKIGK
jgi:hypothetical protein